MSEYHFTDWIEVAGEDVEVDATVIYDPPYCGDSTCPPNEMTIEDIKISKEGTNVSLELPSWMYVIFERKAYKLYKENRRAV